MGLLLACSPSNPGGNGQSGDDTTTLSEEGDDTGDDADATTGSTGGAEGDTTGATSSESTSSTATTSDASTGTTTEVSSTSSSSSETTAANDEDEVPDESSGSSGWESGSTTMDCPSAEVTFTPQIPTILLLIDQSLSMDESFGDQSRWDAVREALTGPGGVIEALEGQVRFGLALYSSRNGFSMNRQCPLLTEVVPAIDNLYAIQTVYDAAEPIDDTPTGDAMTAVAASLLAFEEEGPKVIVLATDGEPDTCADPDPPSGPRPAEARAQSVAAVQAAFETGIRTHVISVGSDIGEVHLQDLANAGIGWQEGDPNATYYVPADQAAMIETFSTIVDEVRDCVLTLDAEILPGQGDRGTVTVNGEVIPFEDPDGWRVNSPSEIELTGAACTLIQGGNVDVRVEFTCEALVPS